MTSVVLLTVSPRAPSTGAPTTLYLAGGGNVKGYRYQGQHWRAGVSALPRFRAEIGFDQNGWNGAARPATSAIVWGPSTKADLAALAAYYWRKAAITIQEGDEATEAFTTRLCGKVADATVRDGQLVITAADLGDDLTKPLVTARFAGTGGAEGGTEAKNRIKRRSWGRVFNVEGGILDKANNIYEFGDPSFPLQQIVTLRDIGRDASPAPAVIAWQGSIAATLAALVASVPVEGSGVVAPSIACAKWWTRPSGPLTADLKGEIGAGYVETVASIADRILTAVTGPAVTNVAAANGWRGAAAGIHVSENETIAATLDRLLMGVSLVWVLDPAGTVTLRELTFTGPVATLISEKAQRLRTLPPVKTRRVGYQKSYRTHTDGEIASTLLWTDVGGTGTPASNATADITVTSIGSQSVAIAGNAVTRNAGVSDYNACARGAAIQGPQFAEMDIVSGNWNIMSLDDDATTTASASLLLQIQFDQSTGNWGIYTNGSLIVGGNAGGGLTGKLRIAYDGIRYRVYANATQLGVDILASASNLVLWPKWTIFGAVAYSGLKAGPYTANIWVDISGPGTPANNATADLVPTSIGSTAVTIIGNTLIRNSGNADFTACVVGAPTLGSALVEAIVPPAGAYAVISLDGDATSFAQAQMDALIYCANGDFAFQVGGVAVFNSLVIGTVAGQKIALGYDGVRWRAYLNGVQMGTDQAATAGLRLWPKWHSYTGGATVTGLRALAANSNIWTDIGGAHVPAPDATADIALVGLGTGAYSIVGNVLTKTSANSTFDTAVRGPLMAKAFSAEVDIIPGNTNFMMAAFQGTGTTYTLSTPDTKFAAQYLHSTGQLYIYVNGTVVAGPLSIGTIAGKLVITYDGVRFRAFVNATQYGGDWPTAAGQALYPCWVAYNTGVYTGLKAGQFAGTNLWGDQGGANVPAPNATSNLTLATGTYSTAQHSIIGNSASRSSATASQWDSFVSSKESFRGNASLTFTFPAVATNMMVGLTTLPQGYAADWRYQYYVLNYAVFCAAGASWQIYELSVPVENLGTSKAGVTFSANTVWRIDYDGANVLYYADSVLMHTTAAAANQVLYAAGSFFEVNGQFNRMTFSTLTDRYLDNMADGATYGRTRLTELTGGLLRLTQAGGGRKLGDLRNLPNIAAFNLSYKFTGTVSYTAAAGTPATATISVTAGNTVGGSVSVAYSAMSVGVSGTGGTTVSYYLYVDDPTNAGGAQTLVATTTALTPYQADGRILIGFCDVFFPTSGTGGGGGGGGGGWCVCADAFVETARGSIAARDVKPGADMLVVLNNDRSGLDWECCTALEIASEDCWRITAANGFEVTVSRSTPITLQDGSLISVPEIAGHELPVDDEGLRWLPCEVTHVGRREVAKIHCNQRTYAAGDKPGRPILTHNPKP